MDAQRSRRTKDQARKAWYAYYRQVRFARWFGFIKIDADWNQISRDRSIRKESRAWSGFAIPARDSDWSQPEIQFQSNPASAH
ncbi:MAG: hypothetical protein ACXWPK_17900 [Isosphaeraceae bacterium]